MEKDNQQPESIIKPDKKKVKRKALTLKERNLVKNIGDGMTPAKAAEKAGYSKTYAENANRDILERPRIKEAIDRLMDRQGLSDEKLLSHLIEGLTCTKTVSVVPVKGSKTGDLQGAEASNIEFVDVPDWTNRRHYLKMAMDLKNLFPDKTVQVKHTNKSLEDMLKEIKGRGVERDITPDQELIEES